MALPSQTRHKQALQVAARMHVDRKGILGFYGNVRFLIHIRLIHSDVLQARTQFGVDQCQVSMMWFQRRDNSVHFLVIFYTQSDVILINGVLDSVGDIAESEPSMGCSWARPCKINANSSVRHRGNGHAPFMGRSTCHLANINLHRFTSIGMVSFDSR